MTLIEVMASLTLLATLLAAMLIARTRATRQWSAADRRARAAAAVDRLLADWSAGPDRLPRDTSGGFERESEFYWRTSVVNRKDLALVHADALRIDVFDVGTDGRFARPVLSIELAIPLAQPTEAP